MSGKTHLLAEWLARHPECVTIQYDHLSIPLVEWREIEARDPARLGCEHDDPRFAQK